MADSPYLIAGNLPFGDSGAGLISAAGGGALGEQYASAYKTALAQNQANYSNILQGYQQTQANQLSAQDAISRGYTGLANQITGGIGQTGNSTLNALLTRQGKIAGGYGSLMTDVQGIINNVGASQAQAIQDAYKAQAGSVTQQMLNSGLGNTTVMGTMQRGPMLDAQKAYVALANQMAQLQAGYHAQLGQSRLNYLDQAAAQETAQRNLTADRMAQYGSSLGLAGLNQQQQAALANTVQANKQLDWMNSIQAKYPDAQAYAQILQQQGMQRQMEADRAQLQRQYEDQQKAQQMLQARGIGGGVGQGANLGYRGTYDTSSHIPGGLGGGGGPFGMSFGVPGQAQPFAAPGSATDLSKNAWNYDVPGMDVQANWDWGGAQSNIANSLPWNAGGGGGNYASSFGGGLAAGADAGSSMEMPWNWSE